MATLSSVSSRHGSQQFFSLVTFECTHPAAEHEVRVVGDHPALGCWDISKSVPLLGEGERPRESASADSGGVLIVCYILPLVITKTSAGWVIEWNHDAITAKKHQHPLKRVQWIGCPGIRVDDEDQPALTSALQDFGCLPIFLDTELAQTFYFGFCRTFLWPTFHNVLKPRCFTQKVWRAYCTANRKFADKVIEVYESGDLVWVHDYHLMLLPSYVLRKLRTARVGLFLHTPFPASEIFRTIPVRDELLRGMLNADLIGFHIFEYARNFLTCCKRMLGLEFEFYPHGFIGVRDHKREVLITVSHVGVEPSVLEAAQVTGERECASWRLAQQLQQLRSEGKSVMLGIDEMERLKGIPLKLLAYEQLLKQRRERGAAKEAQVALVQVAVRARNFTPAADADYEDVRTEVLEIVQRVREAFPGAIDFVELPTISLAQRMQLWALADVAVSTAIKEGVNTFLLESVFARREGPPGVLVLSEFSSCALVLNGTLRVNPWHTEETARTFERALTMGNGEALARRERNMQFLTQMTSASWAERFFVDLLSVTQRADEEWTPIGFGLAGFRRVGWGPTFRALDTTEVLEAYRRARRRAIFLDWGGTIIPIENSNTLFANYYKSDLPPGVIPILQELAQDPMNMLMILSGQERSRMDEVFKNLQGASLAAEHGFHFKLGSFPGVRRVGSTEHWQQLVANFDLGWKRQTAVILEEYTTRTNGAVIQDKGSSLVWKYDDVDPDFASMQVKSLQVALQGLLSEAPVEVIVGKGYLEVRPSGINKGVVLDHFISQLYAHSGGVDFVLCIGDDSADEYMFQALQARFGSGGPPRGPTVFTTVVGRKPSAAQYFLNDTDEVLELCQSLRLHSTRANRNRSMGDLPRHERVWASAGSSQTSCYTSQTSSVGGAGSSQPPEAIGQGASGLDWSRARDAAASLGPAAG